MKRRAFSSPYLGIDTGLFPMLYTRSGHYSVVLKIENPVVQGSGDPLGYNEAHAHYQQMLSILGENTYLQKLDIFSSVKYKGQPTTKEYLSSAYHAHFSGRPYIQLLTYLVLTTHSGRKGLFVTSKEQSRKFETSVKKILDLLAPKNAHILEEKEIRELLARFIAMDFTHETFSMNNWKADAQFLEQGEDVLQSIPLIDTESLTLPGELPVWTADKATGLAKDALSFLSNVAGADTLIYHQVIHVPDQRACIGRLQRKKQRHESIPDPANTVAVRDIDRALADIAERGVLLTESHFNLLVKTKKDSLSQVTGVIENALFQQGILPSRAAYNQMELFTSVLPGNAPSLAAYDRLLTSSEAAACLLYSERLSDSEHTTFPLYFTGAQGVPVAIDTNELPMETGRIGNRNKFVLGPSGSGKSFFMNHLLRQYLEHGVEVVLIDTGHSYQGLCAYVGGTYISYSDEAPITMNPFRISQNEYNEEKRMFLKSLIGLLWKGVDGQLTQVEDTLLGSVIHSYFSEFLTSKPADFFNFDSFYAYSLHRFKKVVEAEQLHVNIAEYGFVLRRFVSGQVYGNVLNAPMNESLFEEPFIVFEIDAIKENKVLFPITTLIIMDVFLQKMRQKTCRKALIIEEAWKAIASPIMASYILYLYKTVRKFRGEAVIVTQEVDDIIGNPIVKDSILANSDCLCLLDQAKFRDNFNRIASLLSLNEVEQAKIFSVNKTRDPDRGPYKEVYIKRGQQGEVYGVEVSLAEYMTYTTERTEKHALWSYVAAYENYEKGLEAFLTDFYESGVTLSAFCKSVTSQPV